jgi:hypothetical protein
MAESTRYDPVLQNNHYDSQGLPNRQGLTGGRIARELTIHFERPAIE